MANNKTLTAIADSIINTGVVVEGMDAFLQALAEAEAKAPKAKASTKKEKETVTYISNEVGIESVVTKGYTLYTSEAKGKLVQQLCLYVSPEPCGVKQGASEFNGDYVMVYPKGLGKSEDTIKGINDAVCSKFISKSGQFGLALPFPAGQNIEVADILANQKFKDAVDKMVLNLAKPKSFLVKVIPVAGKFLAVIFVSKYPATQKSPTICSSTEEVFGKA